MMPLIVHISIYSHIYSCKKKKKLKIIILGLYMLIVSMIYITDNLFLKVTQHKYIRS